MTARALLLVDSSGVRAGVRNGRAPQWGERVAYADRDELREVVKTLAAATNGSGAPARDACIELGADLVQIRTLSDLPPVRGSELRALVEHQCGKFFRRRGAALVVDAVRPEGRRGVVKAAAADETVVQAVAAGVQEAGLAVRDIVPEGDGAVRSLSLLPPELRRLQAKRRRRRVAGLAIGAVAGWVLAGGVYVADLANDHRVVSAELAGLQEPLAVLLNVRNQLGRTAAVVGRIESADGHAGWASAALARLATELPPTAYVTEVSLGPTGDVVVQGFARDPDGTVRAVATALWGDGRFTVDSATSDSEGRPAFRFTTGAEQRP